MQVEIRIPGSKSITNRALILAALCNKNFTIYNAAVCDDTKYMVEGLRELGKEIEEEGERITINSGWKNTEEAVEIYTGNAGTTTRFLTALSTLLEKEIRITGDERMQERPIKPLVKSLNELGAKIETPTGCPPLQIHPQKLRGGEISLPGNISSQYISALLMTAAFAEEKTTINIEQELCSKPYINMTIKTMKAFGLNVMNKNFNQFIIPSETEQKICTIDEYTVEGDASSASYIGAFAAINPEIQVLLKNIKRNSLQGDIEFLKYLESMGAETKETEEGILIQGRAKLESLGEIDMNCAPDLVMTFAVLAMLTEGRTTIKNISNLRIKETDRIAALEKEIKKFGVDIETGDDFISINGKPENLDFQQNVFIETYNDHRIAMCFGLIRHLFPNLEIENPDCVSKSYPEFWEDLAKLEQAIK